MLESKNLCFDMTRNAALKVLRESFSNFRGMGKQTITINLPKCDDPLAPHKLKEELLETWTNIDSIEYDPQAHSLEITLYVYNPA